jgi:hypothetical protein
MKSILIKILFLPYFVLIAILSSVICFFSLFLKAFRIVPFDEKWSFSTLLTAFFGLFWGFLFWGGGLIFGPLGIVWGIYTGFRLFSETKSIENIKYINKNLMRFLSGTYDFNLTENEEVSYTFSKTDYGYKTEREDPEFWKRLSEIEGEGEARQREQASNQKDFDDHDGGWDPGIG